MSDFWQEIFTLLRLCKLTFIIIFLSDAVYFNVTQQPKFPWSCTEYDKNYMSSLNWTVSNTEQCPKQCSSYNSCQLCAKANAENSRTESCLWLESFNQVHLFDFFAKNLRIYLTKRFFLVYFCVCCAFIMLERLLRTDHY